MGEWSRVDLERVKAVAAEASLRQAFRDEQFELQLLLEDLTTEQLTDRARELWAETDAGEQRRIDFCLRILLALKRIPGLSDEEEEDRFEAWCNGFGLTVDRVILDYQRSQKR